MLVDTVNDNRGKSSWTIGGDNHFGNLLLMIMFSVVIDNRLTLAVDISSAMATSYWWGELP